MNKTPEVCQYISDQFFDVLRDLKTLELGPMGGHFTDKILEKTPEVVCVESDQSYCEQLERYLPKKQIVCGDFTEYLRTKNHFGAVVAFGVTYHLVDPIGFFENIVNNINPKYILVDTIHQPHKHQQADAPWPDSQDELLIEDEISNNLGMRQVKKEWKSSNLVSVPGMSVVDRILTNLNYRKIKEKRMSKEEWHGWQPGIFKDGFEIAVFKKEVDETI